MPLSPPVATRERLHTRRIELQGYARPDGLFDIEATLTDTKAQGFAMQSRGWIDAGEPLHGMAMRMTVDEDLTIVAFEAATDYSPYPTCPQVTPNFARLAGIRIQRGFLRAVAERVGGIHGCTHLRELLQQMATVAFQTLYPVLARRRAAAPGKPALLNTCHALRDDGPVAQQRWPAFYTGERAPAPAD